MPNYLTTDNLRYPSPALECILKDLICQTSCKATDYVNVTVDENDILTVTVNDVSDSINLDRILPRNIRVVSFTLEGKNLIIGLSNGMNFPVNIASLPIDNTVNITQNAGTLSIDLNGVITSEDLCPIVRYCETPTTLVGETNMYTFVNEKGQITVFQGGGISSDSNNLATLGSDGKIFVPKTFIVTQTFTASFGDQLTTDFIPLVGTDVFVYRNGVKETINETFTRLGSVYIFTTPFGASSGANAVEEITINYVKS